MLRQVAYRINVKLKGIRLLREACVFPFQVRHDRQQNQLDGGDDLRCSSHLMMGLEMILGGRDSQYWGAS